MNLGIKPDIRSNGMAMAVPQDSGEATRYPGFHLEDDKAEEWMENHPDAKVGDEFEVSIKLKLVSQRQDNMGGSLGFDCLEMTGDDEENDGAETGAGGNGGEGEEEEPAAETPKKKSRYNNPAIDKL